MTFVAIVALGCVGSGEGVPISEGQTGAVPKTFAELQHLVLTPMCADACHKGGAAPKGLSLEAGRSLASLVGVQAVEAPAMKRVAPGQPDASWIVVKVAATDPRRIGARMPRNGPPFMSGAQVAALRRWILAGAREDWVDVPPTAAEVVTPEVVP